MFPALQIDFFEESVPNKQSAWKMFHIEVKSVAGIKMSWVKLFSRINKRLSQVVWVSRVNYMFSYILPVIFFNFW